MKLLPMVLPFRELFCLGCACQTALTCCLLTSHLFPSESKRRENTIPSSFPATRQSLAPKKALTQQQRTTRKPSTFVFSKVNALALTVTICSVSSLLLELSVQRKVKPRLSCGLDWMQMAFSTFLLLTRRLV